jgi:3-dehydroquinate synthase
MITHRIAGNNGESQIVLGESIHHLERYIDGRTYAIITDTHVDTFYHDSFPGERIIVIGTGEGMKTLDTIESLYNKFLEFELDRSSFIVAVGGGVVCDIAGFAASTYLRGISFGFVATTLLAQVDASVGGKNGVNFQGYKNLIGTFNQPEFVLADFSMLNTLEKTYLGCGFAEAIKHGIIADSDLFSFMEAHANDLKNLDPQGIERIVNDSIVIKAAIVNKDEKEKGERRKLNFGHTFGHAIEKTLGFPHGESISIGMVVAAQLSQQLDYITDAEVTRITQVLEAFDLPITITGKKDRIKDSIRKDKKRYGDSIKFVLINDIGTCCIQDVGLDKLEAVIDELFS